MTKAIDTLDDLVQSLLRIQSQSQVWQRTLVGQLKQLDLDIQILRMLVSMERDKAEFEHTANLMHDRLALAVTHIEKSRADNTTKSALRLAKALAAQICEVA